MFNNIFNYYNIRIIAFVGFAFLRSQIFRKIEFSLRKKRILSRVNRPGEEFLTNISPGVKS